MYCENCGMKIQESSRFCENCGVLIGYTIENQALDPAEQQDTPFHRGNEPLQDGVQRGQDNPMFEGSAAMRRKTDQKSSAVTILMVSVVGIAAVFFLVLLLSLEIHYKGIYDREQSGRNQNRDYQYNSRNYDSDDEEYDDYDYDDDEYEDYDEYEDFFGNDSDSAYPDSGSNRHGLF